MNALFSECRQYRYRLDRDIGSGPPIAFLLHNPSTASEIADDPTSKRGIGFARSLGFGRLVFINIWARVATNPKDLWLSDDPVGPDNDHHIGEVAREIVHGAGIFVGAWGRISPPASKRVAAVARVSRVTGIVYQNGADILAFGTNLNGSPKHPLYLPKDAKPSKWASRDSSRHKSVENIHRATTA